MWIFVIFFNWGTSLASFRFIFLALATQICTRYQNSFRSFLLFTFVFFFFRDRLKILYISIGLPWHSYAARNCY